ncbi:MAG: glycolate oxidase subunit GlcE [Bradyrhizobiaceae bacterium]|nr:glycolate oxidase subunit GlcE [Bradyrhizobiaceae bacterium]
MSDTHKPTSRKDIEAMVRWAVGGGKSLEILGHGSKRPIGRAVQYDAAMDLSGLSGIVLYEPQELILSAQAGTPVAEITELLASKGQELAFEPMDYGPLFGGAPGRGTIGGIVAANVSGPRRLKAGAARDHLLGAVAVSGRGETIKSGGRVVKNVTGFDLCKLLAGSWGTLGVLTEVTLKVLPRAPCEATLAVFGLGDREAAEVMAAGLSTPLGVSGAAHLPDHVAAWFDGLDEAEAATLLRIEAASSIDECVEALRKAVRPFGATAVLDQAASRRIWRSIRDARPFRTEGAWGDRPLWRVSTPPMKGHELAAQISPAAALFYDWAGGLLWIAPPATQDGSVGDIRRAVAAVGGHATLVRAGAAARAGIDPFQPESGALAALTKRVKTNFDPRGVLNPGRMWAGV